MKFFLQAALQTALLSLAHAFSTTTVPLTFTGLYYTAPMEIGGQSFDLVVDAGSSTLWVPNADYQCYKTVKKPYANYNCGFVNLYNSSASSTYIPIPDKHLSSQYVSQNFLSGPAALETVTIGGMQFPEQEFMAATIAGWDGLNLTNGIWGFAYPAGTYVYNGSAGNLSDFDTGGILTSKAEAQNFVLKAAADQVIAPVVGLALKASHDVGGDGGSMTVGGAPNVSVTSPWVTLPIQKTAFLNITTAPDRATDIATAPMANDTYDYLYYTIVVEGISVQGSNGAKKFNGNFLAYVDSGSPATLLPPAPAHAINAAFSPPAVYNSSMGQFLTFCNATIPAFSLRLGNQSFVSNPDALLQPVEVGSDICVSAVVNSTSHVHTIGAPFLTGVVAVFDQGANTVAFASTLGSGKANGTGPGTGPSPPIVSASMGVANVIGTGPWALFVFCFVWFGLLL